MEISESLVKERIINEPVLYRLRSNKNTTDTEKGTIDYLNRDFMTFSLFDAWYIKHKDIMEKDNLTLSRDDFQNLLEEKRSLFRLHTRQTSLKELDSEMNSNSLDQFSEADFIFMAQVVKKIDDYHGVWIGIHDNQLIADIQKLENGGVRTKPLKDLLKEADEAMDQYTQGLIKKIDPKVVDLEIDPADLDEMKKQVGGIRHDYLRAGMNLVGGYLDIRDGELKLKREDPEEIVFDEKYLEAIKVGLNTLAKANPAIEEELSDLYPKEELTLDLIDQEIDNFITLNYLSRLKKDDPNVFTEFNVSTTLDLKKVNVIWSKRFISRLAGNIAQNTIRAYKTRDELITTGKLDKPDNLDRSLKISFEEESDFLQIIFEDQATGILTDELKSGEFTGAHGYANTEVNKESTGVGMKEQARLLSKYGGSIKIEDRTDGVRGARVIVRLPLKKD